MPESRTSGDISILYVVLVIFVGGWLLASCPPNGTTYPAEVPSPSPTYCFECVPYYPTPTATPTRQSSCSYNDMVAYQQTEKLREVSSNFADISTKAQETCSPAKDGDAFCQQVVINAAANAETAEQQAYQAWGTISKGCQAYIKSQRDE
jgi:hypothetical protein